MQQLEQCDREPQTPVTPLEIYLWQQQALNAAMDSQRVAGLGIAE